MIACQVLGNDVTLGMAASSGHLQLNVFKPVIIHTLLQSIRLLSDGCNSFREHCVEGMEPDTQRMREHLDNSGGIRSGRQAGADGRTIRITPFAARRPLPPPTVAMAVNGEPGRSDGPVAKRSRQAPGRRADLL